VDSAESAKYAASLGAGAAALKGTVAAAVALLHVVNHSTPDSDSLATLVEAAAYFVLASFVWGLSRLASVLALTLAASEWLLGLVLAPHTGGGIIFLLFFTNGVRGTFSWHRMMNPSPSQTE
jgi:hypothetical protein